MENKAFCQSCSMPMDQAEAPGTNADGSASTDYCSYCYQNGQFTSDMTMEEMIDFCAPFMASGNSGMSEEEAKAQMRGFFPKLKRWAKQA